MVRLATDTGASSPEAALTPSEGMATAAWPLDGHGKVTEDAGTASTRGWTVANTGMVSGRRKRTVTKVATPATSTTASPSTIHVRARRGRAERRAWRPGRA